MAGRQYAGYLAGNETGLYWAQVSNACGICQDSVEAIFDPLPQAVDLGPDQKLCEGDTIMLDAMSFSTPTAPLSYQWNSGETDPIIFPTESGQYIVNISNRCGEVQASVNLEFAPPALPNLGADTIMCIEEPYILSFDVTQADGASYRWQDGFGGPIYQVSKPGVYYVDVTNSCGTFSDTLLIEEVDCNCQIYAANAFTPNADGHNDDFKLASACNVLSADFMIFDRWGQMVFQASNLEDAWDGTYKGRHVPEGVYIWVLNYSSEGSRGAFSQRLNGSVTLFR